MLLIFPLIYAYVFVVSVRRTELSYRQGQKAENAQPVRDLHVRRYLQRRLNELLVALCVEDQFMRAAQPEWLKAVYIYIYPCLMQEFGFCCLRYLNNIHMVFISAIFNLQNMSSMAAENSESMSTLFLV